MSGERGRALSSVALFLYVMALLLVVLTPGSGGPDRILAWLTEKTVGAGAPWQPTGQLVEIVLNGVLTFPATLLASVVWPGPSWRDWTAWAFLAFSAVELIQGLLLPARNGSFSDIVANTIGCCLGALAVAVARRVAGRRTG